MEAGLVSVITPVHNRPKRMIECIESVRRQGYAKVEHIVVDDGSTDSTAEGAARVFDDLIRAGRLRIIRQENLGPCAARNRGIAESRGEFIAYLDSDDLYLDTHAATLAQPLLADRQVGVSYGGHLEIWYSPEGTITRRETGPAEAVNPLTLRFKNLIPLFFMHRRSLLDDVGTFDADCRGFEDWDLLMRLSEVTRFSGSAAATCVWRHYGAETSVTTELQGTSRERTYLRVQKRGLRREIEGRIRIPELRDDLAALNRHLFDGILGAAKKRKWEAESPVYDVPIEKIAEGILDSLLQCLQRALDNHPAPARFQITIADPESPAVEWIEKLNRICDEEGLPRLLVRSGLC